MAKREGLEPKSNAQRQKEFRQRKKLEKERLAAPNPESAIPAEPAIAHVSRSQAEFDVDYWWKTIEGVMSQAVQVAVPAIPGESFSEFDARVRAASGSGPWETEASEQMRRRIQVHRKLGPNRGVQQKPQARQPVQAGR